MSDLLGTVGEAGLRFFGKVTASVSHEIKNVMAIINENAGLLEDLLTLAAKKGVPPEAVRLRDLVGKVTTQIRRGDGIVRNLNNFAHSVDESSKTVDLGDMLSLVAALSGRQASMKGVTIEAADKGPISVTTSPFALQHLVWRCVEFATGAVGPEKRISLRVKASEGGATIRVTGLSPASPPKGFPGECERDLTASLGGRLSVDGSAGEVVIDLPKAVTSGKGTV